MARFRPAHFGQSALSALRPQAFRRSSNDLKRFQKVPAALLFASNIFRAASQWILVWLFAVIGGSSVVGKYTLALAVVSPVFTVFEMSLRNVYVTLHLEIPFNTYVRIRTVACCASLILVAILGFSNVSSLTLLMSIGLIKTADSFVNIAYGAHQKRGQLTTIAVTSILNSCLTVAAGGTIYWLSGSVALGLLGSFFGSMIIVIIVVLPMVKREGRPSPFTRNLRSEIKSLLRAGIPSGIAYAAITILAYLPVYFLGATSGSSDVGAFAVLIYFVTFANLFYNSIQESTLHTLVAERKQGGVLALWRYSRRLLVILLICGGLSGGVMVAFGANIIRLVYGTDFFVPSGAILLISLALCLLPMVYVSGGILLAMNRYGVQLWISASCVIVSVLTGFLLLSDFDLRSAATIVLVGTACRAVLGIATSILPIGFQVWKSRNRRIDSCQE